jgi:hypothetical protein
MLPEIGFGHRKVYIPLVLLTTELSHRQCSKCKNEHRAITPKLSQAELK